MQRFRDCPYVQNLISLELDTSHFAFIGSAPLFARGWIRDLGDIDVVARASAWDAAARLGDAVAIPHSTVRKISLFQGTVEILDGWIPKISSADDMINRADIIGGLRFVSLDVLKSVKQFLARPKDLVHLRIISEHESTLPMPASDTNN